MWQKLLDGIADALDEGRNDIPEALTNEECFKIGWNFVLNGKKYVCKAPDPRGLAAIWEKVKEHMIEE